MRPSTTLRLGAVTTALITPFRGEAVDLTALESLAIRQIQSGIGGIAVCTVTGEGPTLSMLERSAVLQCCVRAADSRVPIVAATGTNCTLETIRLTQQAEALGAAAAIVTVPYYSKPGQRGILHHFETLATETSIPLIVDDNPARSASCLSPRTLEALASIPSIIGIIGHGMQPQPPALRARLLFLSDSDDTSLAFLSGYGTGIISSGANIHPRLFNSLHNAALAGNIPGALALERRLHTVMQILGDQAPAQIKYALRLLLDIDPTVRLPMVELDTEEKAAVFEALTSTAETHPLAS
ncbi:4-hydroxy-tetrahydrodipicolinate synthase [Rhizobium sp. AC44/96]|uniref:dihydrodipicolinate synthase family protein n=1 Tax=Rhizobium sp. AC44/96 TaxID=1841654 RepID=UPI00080F73FF|nr:dihydrodipicolinate synthase family protein [Rhizobium sp. AC44/96]OCJ18366.1 4-hydroxy-tetrahydrodipicolinate synthase [Rhizobium sp. AC44/96]